MTGFIGKDTEGKLQHLAVADLIIRGAGLMLNAKEIQIWKDVLAL